MANIYMSYIIHQLTENDLSSKKCNFLNTNFLATRIK